MTKPRPCGCKGCRTCLVCETQFGAESLKLELKLEKELSYVYCPYCNKAWKGWDVNMYKEHPDHIGESIDLPGVYIEMDFISEQEETSLMQELDEIPWDMSQSGRRKQNYGPKTNFKKKKIVPGNFEGFPKCTKFIQDRFHTIDLLNNYETIEQCSLEYDPQKGASIDPHIDDCWIWGERIITLNFLSDTVLTLTRYKGDLKKYNLECAKEYPPILNQEGKLFKNCEPVSALDATKPRTEVDRIIRIPMIRRSLAVLYGELRYHWEHFIIREDITARRVCLAYREFTPPYLSSGSKGEIGDVIRLKAKLFWDHKKKYNLNNGMGTIK